MPNQYSHIPEERFWSKVDTSGGPDACWPFRGRLSYDGYGLIKIAGKNTRTHRFSWALAHPDEPIPPGIFVCHACDNPICVNPAHLWLGTNADNLADMVAKGRSFRPQGTLHNMAKLTDDQVRTIRARYAAGGVAQRRLAAEYGVSGRAILFVLQRKHWKHVS